MAEGRCPQAGTCCLGLAGSLACAAEQDTGRPPLRRSNAGRGGEQKEEWQAAEPVRRRPPPAPLADGFILQLVWQQRCSLVVALAALLVCVFISLLSPVLSGGLFEALVQGRPLAE